MSAGGDRFDFHVHTRCSDGAWSPAEVLQRAERAGLAGVSITDHDTTDAYAEVAAATAKGPAAGLRLLAGVEVSAAYEGVELHILGYFPGGLTDGVRELTDRLLAERQERIQDGIRRLAERGIDLDWEEVAREAGGRVVSRGHLALVLVRKRFVANINAAFPDLLGPDTVRPPRVDAREIVDSIASLQGIAVWAHPSSAHLDRFLSGLMDAGLRGVEVHTPRRGKSERRQVERRAGELGLLVSGGSDWHGHGECKALGDFAVQRPEIEGFLQAIGW